MPLNARPVAPVGLSEIPPYAGSGRVHVIIDTPQGSGNKFKYDPALRIFKLSRTLPSGMHFPFDFGFIPGTVAEDGDALDVMVLVDAPSFVGCLMSVELLGVIGAIQKEGRHRIRNDRLVAVPVTPVNAPRYTDLAAVPRVLLEGIEHFFVAYNQAQGREFRVTGRRGASAAHRAVRAATIKDGSAPRRSRAK